jgi:amino acid transporter
LAAFMVVWNLWLYAVVFLATVGLLLGTNLSYVVGPQGAWLATNKAFIMLLNVGMIAGLMTLAARGLGVSKWLHNTGSVMLMLSFLVLIALPFVHMARGTLPDYHPFAVALPALSLFSLNVFGKMAVGALSGFEYVAVLAGETKDAGRSIGRATLIAAPVISAMFILGTSSVLAFVPVDRINLIGPIPQVFSIGFGATAVGSIMAGVAILLRVHRDVANADGGGVEQPAPGLVHDAPSQVPDAREFDSLRRARGPRVRCGRHRRRR